MTEEELEKEAEEIMMQKVIKDNDCIITPCKTLEDCQLIDFCFDDMVDAFKDGAEFGYNKANDWHKIADCDLPKDDRCVLVYREDEEPQLDYYLNEEGYWKSEKWDREYYARKGETPPVSSIIAWKEIVLPELKESK